MVVGGGYVGIETAENLKHLGIDTTLVEAAPNILAPFDSEISNILEYELVNNGIELMTSEKSSLNFQRGMQIKLLLSFESWKNLLQQIW